jgi:hypothetical protein
VTFNLPTTTITRYSIILSIINIIHVLCCSGLNSDFEAPISSGGDDIFSRKNSSAATPPSPVAKGASPQSPVVKDAAALEEESERASLSFLGARRDGDGDTSLALDFSVGTFAGDFFNVCAARDLPTINVHTTCSF